jgi:general secretion pathway protein J
MTCRRVRRSTRETTRARRGFTLLEVVLALTLTAIAAGIASSSLTAARRTSEVIGEHQAHAEADTRVRALLADMLRHAPDASSVEAPLLSLARDGDHEVLTFLSTGVDMPFGTGPVWTVTVRMDGDSLVLEATRPDASMRRVRIGDVSRFEVRVLNAATALEPAQWRADWPLAQARPAAIALSWAHSGGGAPLAPLVVSLDPLQSGTPGMTTGTAR